MVVHQLKIHKGIHQVPTNQLLVHALAYKIFLKKIGWFKKIYLFYLVNSRTLITSKVILVLNNLVFLILVLQFVVHIFELILEFYMVYLSFLEFFEHYQYLLEILLNHPLKKRKFIFPFCFFLNPLNAI